MTPNTFVVTYASGKVQKTNAELDSVEAFCNQHFGSTWPDAQDAGTTVEMTEFQGELEPDRPADEDIDPEGGDDDDTKGGGTGGHEFDHALGALGGFPTGNEGSLSTATSTSQLPAEGAFSLSTSQLSVEGAQGSETGASQAKPASEQLSEQPAGGPAPGGAADQAQQ